MSELVGYIRKKDNHIKIALHLESLNTAKRITSKDGSEYVYLCISDGNLRALLSGEKEVTSINTLE